MKRRHIHVPIVAFVMLFIPSAFTHAVPSILEGVVDVTPNIGGIIEDVVEAGDNLNQNGTFSTPLSNTGHLLSFVQGHELSFDLNTEHDGTSLGVTINDTNNIAGVIAAGTSVNAYVYRLDPNPNSGNNIRTTITFEEEILGLNGGQTGGANGGIAHTIYNTEFNTFGAIGVMEGNFDFSGADEILSLSADGKTITIESGQGGGGRDSLWIITAATLDVPEPATATLGLIGLAGLLRRRRAV